MNILDMTSEWLDSDGGALKVLEAAQNVYVDIDLVGAERLLIARKHLLFVCIFMVVTSLIKCAL